MVVNLTTALLYHSSVPAIYLFEKPSLLLSVTRLVLNINEKTSDLKLIIF